MTELARLRELLDGRSVLTESSDMEPYVRDILRLFDCTPLAVVRPAATEAVCKTIGWCAREGVAVVPQGGNTGLCGGAIAAGLERAVVLSLDRMRRIRSVDPLDNSLTAEAGVTLSDVRAAAKAADRRFTLSHGAEGSSRIGGNLSTNAGGNNALRFGTARDQVLGLEVVLPDGSIWDGLRRLRKNTAGYDLKQLFIGAEGTLGIITAAVLKLRARADRRASAMVAVADASAALDVLRRLEAEVGEVLEAFEMLSAAAVAKALTLEGVRAPFTTAYPWVILVEAASASRHLALEEAFEHTLGKAIEAGVVVDAVVAQSGPQREDFWHLRESVALACIDDESCFKADTAVPVSAIPKFIEEASAAVSRVVPEAKPVPFGHGGDGNLHFNVCRPQAMSHQAFRARWAEVEKGIFQASLALGGTISAEHGIGRLKGAHFADAVAPREQAAMRAIKSALDPQNLLNPGVLFSTGP